MKNGSDRFGFAVYAALATLAVTLAWALASAAINLAAFA